MAQRLAVIGFIVALVVAIFAFTQQQEAVKEARAAQEAREEAQAQQSVALAQAQDAADQQQQAENSAATLMVNAQKAATAQANAQNDSSTAQAQMEDASTAAAQLQATVTAQRGDMQATAQAGQDAVATINAETTEELSTIQAVVNAQATTQTSFDSALGTATAQVDLAEFALQSAEDDRALALTQAWGAATALAESNSQLATAQAQLNGSTAVPTEQAFIATITPVPSEEATTEATAEPSGTPSLDLTENFTTKDGAVSLKYPAGWAVGELDNGVIVVGSSSEVLSRSQLAVPEGELELQLLVAQASNLPGLQANAQPRDVLEAFTNVVTQQGGTADINTAEDVTLGEHKGARLQGTDGTNDILITVLEISDDVYAVNFVLSAKGGLPAYSELIDNLLASLTFKSSEAIPHDYKRGTPCNTGI